MIFLFGYGMAYGEPSFVGKKFYFSVDLTDGVNYLILILTSSICSNLSLGAISER
jgi:CRISPR/Cas system-associated protein Csx1